MERIETLAHHSALERHTDSDKDQPARFLPWDSTFFQKRIARVNGSTLNDDFLPRLFAWCAEERIDCLYFLASAEDIDTLRLAEDHNFRHVGIRMALEYKLPAEVDPPNSIRLVRPEDISSMAYLASISYPNTRFYRDERLPRDKCAELYSTWFERSCKGYADCVLIADHDNEPAGFITCSVGPTEGEIGLLAVEPRFRGSGLGSALVDAALCYFSEHRLKRASVVTQGSNPLSQRLYQRCGFTTKSVEIWYHLWLDKNTVASSDDPRGLL